jgi:protease II
MSDDKPLFTVANELLFNHFDNESSGNYIAHEIEDNESGHSYLITMQKIDGETPLHQLKELKEDHEKLKAEHKNLIEEMALLKLMYWRI